MTTGPVSGVHVQPTSRESSYLLIIYVTFCNLCREGVGLVRWAVAR